MKRTYLTVLLALLFTLLYLPASGICEEGVSGGSAGSIHEIRNLKGEMVLSEIMDPVFIPELVELLDSEDVQVVNQASMALVRHGQPAIEHLMEGYEKGINPVMVAKTLAGIDHPDSTKALLDIVAAGGDGAEYAAGSLGNMGEDSIPVLTEALRDVDTRAAAVAGLVAIQSDGKAEAVAPYLIDPDPDIREAAVRVLGEDVEANVPRLVPMLDDRDGGVRKLALKYLKGLKIDGIEDKLVSLLGDPDVETRQFASYALRDNATSASVEALLDTVKNDNDKMTRANCIISLGNIGDTRAVLPLIDILDNGEEALYAHVFIALGALKADEAIPYVEEIIASKRQPWSVVEASLDFYKGITGPASVDPWIPYLDTDDEHYLLATIEIMATKGTSKDTEAIKALEKLAAGGNARMAAEAERAIAAMKQR